MRTSRCAAGGSVLPRLRQNHAPIRRMLLHAAIRHSSLTQRPSGPLQPSTDLTKRFVSHQAVDLLPRSHTCGQLRETDEGSSVALQGWVASVRKLGGLVFVVLRDRHGSVQLRIDTPEAEAIALLTSPESVVCVEGVVTLRPGGMRNREMPTGAIEVAASGFRVANPAGPLPLPVSAKRVHGEESRLRHRHLDLRSAAMQGRLATRSQASLGVRNFLHGEGFLEVETPTLFKSTPEGAREFLVPAAAPGKFYALPQSPQQYKQLLMAGGVDRYFQLARCYRDEGQRADRQPEFTQIDMEVAFATREEIYRVVEAPS